MLDEQVLPANINQMVKQNPLLVALQVLFAFSRSCVSFFLIAVLVGAGSGAGIGVGVDFVAGGGCDRDFCC